MTAIFIISDDAQSLQFIQQVVNDAGYSAYAATRLEAVAAYLTTVQPELVIVDIEHHPANTLQVCHEIRQIPGLGGLPLLLLGHYTSAAQVAHLLDAGADDVLKKPFAVRELLARIRVLLRWAERLQEDHLPTVRLDARERSIFIDQQQVRLTHVEYQLIDFLCRHHSRYHSADDLLHNLWNYPPETGDTALIRNHIRNLRCKLESDPDRPNVLISQYGRGYKIRGIVQNV